MISSTNGAAFDGVLCSLSRTRSSVYLGVEDLSHLSSWRTRREEGETETYTAREGDGRLECCSKQKHIYTQAYLVGIVARGGWIRLKPTRR